MWVSIGALDWLRHAYKICFSQLRQHLYFFSSKSSLAGVLSMGARTAGDGRRVVAATMSTRFHMGTRLFFRVYAIIFHRPPFRDSLPKVDRYGVVSVCQILVEGSSIGTHTVQSTRYTQSQWVGEYLSHKCKCKCGVMLNKLYSNYDEG